MARVQARIPLPADVRAGLDAVRQKWNPERAAGNPAHVTVVYHDEAPDPAELAGRLRAAAARIAPFDLVLGPVERFPEPARGAYLAVADPTAGVGAVRAVVLAPPFFPRARFGLHVTLLHPDQGERLDAAWADLAATPTGATFRVAELQLVGSRHEVLAVIPLTGAVGDR